MSANDRRVYVPNDAGHNFTPAEEFGRLVYITKGFIPRSNVEAFAGRCEKAMRSSTEEDLIVVSSLNIFVAVVVGIQAAKFGIVHLLQWKRDRYVLRTVDFEALIRRGQGDQG